MAKKWSDILKDPSLYPDDFSISLKDGQTMTLGDMRSYDREHEGELTTRLTSREQEVANREKDVDIATKNLATVVEKTAERAGLSVEDFLQGKAPTRKQIAQSADLDENDPLVGSLVKEIKTLREEIKSTKMDIDRTRKDALGPMLTTYLNREYRRDWEKLEKTLPKDHGLDAKKVMEYATKRGLKTDDGMLDLEASARDLTYDVRVRAEAEKIANDLRKKDDDARVLAAAPKPSGTHINVKTDKSLLNEKGKTKNFDEVLQDALTDTDLWRGVAGQA